MASERRRGPFDRILSVASDPAERRVPDRAAIYVAGTIVGLAILLLVLVLPPISVLSRGGGGDGSAIRATPGTADSYTSTIRGGMPRLPPGLAAASALFDLSAPSDQRGASRITIPLKEKQSEQRTLGLYSYQDGKWQRLSDVALIAGGEAARGDVSELPGNVAVLKRNKTTLQVAGSLPAGTTVDPRAAALLTVLHPVVFLPAADGTITGTPPSVPPTAYRVVPTILPFTPDVIDTILRSAELQARHATAIADAVKQGNYAGINVDYRNVNAALRKQFTDFVTLLQKDLQADGRTLTLTLPLPLNDGGTVQSGAYDWEALGKLADTIEVAGGLDQELYFQETEAALAYITERVDRTKVLLGVTSLSVERGNDGLRAMPLYDALSRASVVVLKPQAAIAPSATVQIVAQNLAESEGASGMRWDATSRAVTFSYPGRGGKRTVWLANSFSAGFRLELAQRYGLGGVSIDDASAEGGGGDVWAPVQQLADSGSVTLSRPNGELLTPAWASADGSLAAQSGESVAWTAPAKAGAYTVTLIVSDGVVRAGQVVSLDVTAPP